MCVRACACVQICMLCASLFSSNLHSYTHGCTLVACGLPMIPANLGRFCLSTSYSRFPARTHLLAGPESRDSGKWVGTEHTRTGSMKMGVVYRTM